MEQSESQGMKIVSIEFPLLAESGSSNRWIFSGTKDRYTSEAAIHISVAENSVRTSASPPKAAAELISLLGAAELISLLGAAELISLLGAADDPERPRR